MPLGELGGGGGWGAADRNQVRERAVSRRVVVDLTWKQTREKMIQCLLTLA